MALNQVSFRWSDEKLAAVDAARGDVPRSVWVWRVLERELGLQDSNRRAVEAERRRSADAVRERATMPAEEQAERFGRQPRVESRKPFDVKPDPKAESLDDLGLVRASELPVNPRVRSSASRPFRPAPKKGS